MEQTWYLSTVFLCSEFKFKNINILLGSKFFWAKMFAVIFIWGDLFLQIAGKMAKLTKILCHTISLSNLANNLLSPVVSTNIACARLSDSIRSGDVLKAKLRRARLGKGGGGGGKNAALSLSSPRAFFAFLLTERLSTTISEPGTGYNKIILQTDPNQNLK